MASSRVVCISVTTPSGKQRLRETREYLATAEFGSPPFPEIVSFEVERNNKDPIMGCTQSHAAVAKEAKEHLGVAVTTVMESDARPAPNRHSDWFDLILPFARQRGDIDLLLGGMSSFSRLRAGQQEVIPVPGTEYFLVQVFGGSGFFFYSPVTAAGCDAIIHHGMVAGKPNENANMRLYSRHVDVGVLSRKELRIFCVLPFVSNTADGMSDTRNTVVSFSGRVTNTEKSMKSVYLDRWKRQREEQERQRQKQTTGAVQK